MQRETGTARFKGELIGQLVELLVADAFRKTHPQHRADHFLARETRERAEPGLATVSGIKAEPRLHAQPVANPGRRSSPWRG